MLHPFFPDREQRLYEVHQPARRDNTQHEKSSRMQCRNFRETTSSQSGITSAGMKITTRQALLGREGQ